MIRIGEVNKLVIKKGVDFGFYLDGGDDIEILLPLRYVTEEMKVDDEIEVFIYTDSEDRLVATTETPKAMVGDFAFLEVTAVTRYGAFMDWGLLKDLFVPFSEQKVRMEIGNSYVVYLYVDHNTQRVVASAKLNKFLDNKSPRYEINDTVEIVVEKRTDLGYKVVVDNMYSGLVYNNEIFKPINIGEKMTAYIKNVRSDDKLDISLTSNKSVVRVKSLADIILDFMKDNGGKMSYTDSSSPEDIKAEFKCSKKDFKKTLGMLYRNGYIIINDTEVILKK
ncbi:MAG: S1-like domain-containing RNA-binding protein [Bacteroidales bacterium]